MGHDSANAEVCQGRNLPWLQDDDARDVWGLWAITYRDCVILDAQNRVFAIFNLTLNNLADPVKYLALKNLLIAASMAAP